MPAARPALQQSIDVDVCIVGAGYTGLWTAWALAGADGAGGWRIAVVEAERVGFGASGRNGGWLSGLLPGNRTVMARGPGGRTGVVALQRRLIDSVREVVGICSAEGIDADIHVGGTLAVARQAAQMDRLRASLAEGREWELGPDDVCELGPLDTDARVRVTGAVGSLFSPHCARVQPAKLVRGLATAVEGKGVEIFERSPALGIDPVLGAGGVGATASGSGAVGGGALWRVRTPGADVTARWVVRATEGFTARLPGLHRRLLPVNSSMIVTDPLPAQVWDTIGWSGLETVRDGAHAYTYLQRTADDRIAIGGRGIPYRFGSRIDGSGRTPRSTVSALTDALHRLFPATTEVAVAHAWSGVLGVARDWCPTVGVDRRGDGGLAWAGGYVGDGVTTSYLAGLTLADLILGRHTPLTTLPWVGHTSRDWEPEPMRWLGARGIYALYRAADRSEARRPGSARTSRWATLADRVSGRD